MRKSLFTLLAAMLAVLSVSAQDNLALNKTTKATSGTASLAVDGNVGSRWESKQGEDPQTWQVDLGSAQDFNTIQIVWEGAYASNFAIYASNEVGPDGYVALDDANKIYSTTGLTLTGFPNPNYQVITLDKAAKAQYIRFEGTQRATPYGYSFWEFGVYNLTEALKTTSVTLTSQIANNSLEKGSTGQFSVAAKNQLGGTQTTTGDVTYTSSDPSVGTIDANGLFTAVSAGTTTISATVDGVKSNEITVTVLAGAKVDLFTNNQYRIFTIGKTDGSSKVGAFDDNDRSLWSLLGNTTTGTDEASRTYDVGFIADLGDIYDLSSASLHFEGACSKAYTLEFAGTDGTFGNTVNGGTGADGINNHTEALSFDVKNVRYVKFLSTKAATQYGVKLFDFSLYGTKTADVTDTEAPQITTAEAGATTENSITLNLTATDNSSKYLTYKVAADGLATITNASTDNESGKAISVVIPNLVRGNTYNFTVTAIDANGNKSEAKTVSAKTAGETFTLTAAPTPTVDKADVVASIFSDAYDPATTYTLAQWGSATECKDEKVGDDNLIHFTNFSYVGFEFKNDVDLSKATYVHFDILPVTDLNSIVFTPIMRGGKTESAVSTSNLNITLNKNEWNSIDIPLSALGLDFANYKAFQLKLTGGRGNDNIYIDNIYFYTKKESFNVNVKNGIAKVLGPVMTDDEVAQINDADAMAIDLTSVSSIADGVKITPKHPNALIFVSGTVTNNVATADEKFAGLAETTNNLVVKQIYNFPIKQLQFIDKAGEPQWWGEDATNNDTRFISTGTSGYKVTTTIPAKSYITYYPTSVVLAANIPAGITAWEAVDYKNGTVSFNKNVNDLAAFFPYVLYNSNDEDTEISFSGTGDFNLINWSTVNVADHKIGASNAVIKGNFLNEMTTDGNQWILQKEDDGTTTIKKANGAKISAFRAYFTGLGDVAQAKAVFNGGEATGITAIQNAEANVQSSDAIYNIAGQRVGKDYKGLVIKNGKKYINK